MMDDLIGIGFRIGKAFLLGLVMYFSLRALDFSVGASFAFCLVPAILGSLNIMTKLIFTLTGIVLIVASGSTLFKEKVSPDDSTKLIQSFSNEMKSGASAVQSVSNGIKSGANVVLPSVFTSASGISSTGPAGSSSNAHLSQNGSVAQKLKDLNALYKEGLINKKDFETKKQEILKSM